MKRTRLIPAILLGMALFCVHGFSEDVSFVGTLNPRHDVQVSSQVDGTVKHTLVDIGDRVSRGQAILKLDDERANLELQIRIGQLNELLAKLGVTVNNAEDFDIYEIPKVVSAQEDFKEKERNLKRMRLLREKGAASQEQLDKAETEFQKSKADLKAAVNEITGEKAIITQLKSGIKLFVKDLNDTTVTSPINGYVQERYVDVGEYLKKGQIVYRILDTDVLKLTGSIPSRFAGNVKKGQKVSFSVEGYGDKTFQGSVSRIAPGIDPQTRTLLLEILVDNQDQTLKPGYFVKARLVEGMTKAKEQ